MDKKVVDSNITYYEINKQLMQNERALDPIELNLKASAIRKNLLDKGVPGYLMLLCNDRKDFTVFEFKNSNDTALSLFEKDFKECLMNRGTVLTIEEVDNRDWEIWIRDESGNNFCYYLFDYSNAVLVY
jgi:hypothetical protein